MKKQQNIKKEIEKHLYMILNLAGVKESVADKVVPVGVERIMDDVVREAFERFIEETKIPLSEISSAPSDLADTSYWQEVNNAYLEGYNQALEDVNQKQAKWLEENL